jgi:hypothetical protein
MLPVHTISAGMFVRNKVNNIIVAVANPPTNPLIKPGSNSGLKITRIIVNGIRNINPITDSRISFAFSL